MKKELADKKAGIQKPKPERTAENKSHGQAVLPYVAGVSERMRRIMRKYRLTAPLRPHRTLRQMLVHPKDKIEDLQKCGTVYQIDCLSCDKAYIGETGRKLEIRKGEHLDESEKVNSRRKTRSTSQNEDNSKLKSGIAQHLRDNNHIMNWDSTKIIDRESNRKRRWIKEAIHVRKRGAQNTMNRDEGGYELSHVWDPVLRQAPTGARRRHPKQHS